MNNSIGIIIPCYNGWNCFSKCLNSLENQTVKPDQIIIGDDCSSDDSFKQLTEYTKKSSLNIVLFKNKKNYGPGYTRNVALKLLQTEYVAFCDCDDWYELDFIEKIKETINEKSPDVVIFDNYKIIGESRTKANATADLNEKDKAVILALYPMSLWRFVVAKKIIDRVFFPSLYNGEDGAVAAQILSIAEKTTVLDNAFYNYFIRKESASTKPTKKAYIGMLDAYKVIEQHIDSAYKEETEFLGIKYVCYAATINAYKAGVDSSTVKCFVSDFNSSHRKWNKNRYYKRMSYFRRVYLFFVRHNFILPCKLIVWLYTKVVDYNG